MVPRTDLDQKTFSPTCAKIWRRRNSSACRYVGALDSALSVEPWPTSTKAESEKSISNTRECLADGQISRKFDEA